MAWRGCGVDRDGRGLVWGLRGGGSGGWVRRWGGWVAVAVASDGPRWVAVEMEGLVDPFEFCFLSVVACGNKVSASGEGSDGGALVREGLVRIPANVLVGVGQLPIDVKF